MQDSRRCTRYHFLSVCEENNFCGENTVDGKFFVTARMEDLSRLLQSYEKLGIGISEELVENFSRKRKQPEILQVFTSYIQSMGRIINPVDPVRKSEPGESGAEEDGCRWSF